MSGTVENNGYFRKKHGHLNSYLRAESRIRGTVLGANQCLAKLSCF